MRKIFLIILNIIVLILNLRADNLEILRSKLKNRLVELTEKLDGVCGVAVKDLKSGFTVLMNEKEIFPQASSIKIAILLEVFKQAEEGKLKFEEFIDLKKEFKVGGSGILQHLGEPSLSISIKDLCTLMIVLSDNTATNILIERIGIDSVNKRLEGTGLRNTKLKRKMIDVLAVREGRENISTPLEMMVLLEKIYRGKILNEPYRSEFLKTLSIPKESYIRKGVPENIPVASKPGSLPRVRCESGIVLFMDRPFILCVMTSYLKKEEDGEILISEISKILFDYFSTIEKSTIYGRGID